MLYLCCTQKLYLCISIMATANIVLRKKPNKQGLYPLAIRITKDRKSIFISVGQYISLSDWDERQSKVKKSHPNSGRLNNLLLKKLSESNDKLLEIESTENQVSQYTLKQKLRKSFKKTGLFSILDAYLLNLERSKRFSQLAPEKSRVANLKSFIGSNEIYMEDVTDSLIEKYKLYLKVEKELKDRSIVNHLISLRTIYNIAIKEGYVDAKHYPFGKDKIKIRLPESNKIGLNKEEVKILEDLPIEPSNPRYHAKNVWLFAFYFAGMRVSDVLQIKWSDIVDGRLLYTMGKNKKVLSLVIPKKALAIIKAYSNPKAPKSGFVFPELQNCNTEDLKQLRTRINTSVRKFNKHLLNLSKELGIDKKLSMHIARHTFGNLSGDKIPIQMLQRLYRHSSITTTINYQGNFIHKDADDALESVIDF